MCLTILLLGVGGSASTDGGDGGGELRRIRSVGAWAALADVEIVLCSDVANSFVGPRGAAAVFAPQKAPTPRPSRCSTQDCGRGRQRSTRRSAPTWP